ncbi:MAG: MBL fold metallo-hydrolase, partial [Acidobacteria bacterium]|nr:MBL fold metallo-hydrolase [Acidobacteriota bacterium]
HARPSVWGALAAEAGVGRVVASHVSTSSPQVLADSLGYLRAAYGGPVTVAEDLLCVPLP